MSANNENPQGFKVSISEADFVSFNHIGTGFTFVSFLVYVAVVVVILASSGFYQGLTSQGFFRYIWMPLGLLAVLCGTYFNYIRFRSIRFFRSHPDMTAEVTYQILDKGLNIKRGRDQKTIPWDSFHRIVANRRVTAFFTSKANAYIIPNGALAEHTDTARLAELLRSKLPKRRLRLPKGW